MKNELSDPADFEEIKENFDFYTPAIGASHRILQSIRIVMLVMTLVLFVWGAFIMEPISQLIYFTCWGQHLSNASLILSIWAGLKHHQNSYSLKKTAGIILEITFVS